MDDGQKLPLQTTALYRVKIPLRGTARPHQPSLVFPRGTLLERLPGHGNAFSPVRCNGIEYLVLEHDLTQRCERVLGRPRGVRFAGA